ncbi:MAG: 3-hydroxyacyl-CoA dehydrogenase NAD-binding domain-containing protein, partial [Nocardioidaceae bacterium]
MAYTLPDDVDDRPIAIDGAGTLGRRIAAVYAGGGSDVRIFDTSVGQRQAAGDYVERNIATTRRRLDLHPDGAGTVEVAEDLPSAVRDAWMVIEAVPERVDLKT